MNLKKNILSKINQLSQDQEYADSIKNKAITAVLGGAGSPEWESFMEEFAHNEEELDYLLDYKQLSIAKGAIFARAALVADGVFGFAHMDEYINIFEKEDDVSESAVPEFITKKEKMGHLFNAPFKFGFYRLLSEEKTLTLSDKPLTPATLNDISRLVSSVQEFQQTINTIRGLPQLPVLIKSISQNSPIEISLSGASEAVEQIKKMVVPWRRKHDKAITQLGEKEKKVQIKILEAQILEKKTQAIKSEAEAEKIKAEAEKIRAEVEKTKLENDKLRLELQRAKVTLAVEIVAQLAPNLSEQDRLGYVFKMLSNIESLALSDLIDTGENSADDTPLLPS